MNADSSKNNFLDLAVNVITNNVSEKDSQSLEGELKMGAEQQKELEDYYYIWNSCSLIDKTATSKEIEDAYHRLKDKIKIPKKEIVLESKQRIISKEILKIAAIFILAFALGALGYYFFNFNNLKNEKIVYNEIDVPYGAKSQIKLPDGTNVWLNAGSALKYPKNFDRVNRDVYLKGEGYFEVSKNKKLPFVVHADDIEVKAIGTVFNVKSYPDEEIIETTLVEGMVKVTKKSTNSKKYNHVYLKPNQKVTFRRDDFETVNLNEKESSKNTVKKDISTKKIENKKVPEVVITEKIATDLYTSWKDERWIIESEELGSLATKLERRYDIKIKFNDKNLKTFKFTGTLKDDPLEQVLKAMELTAPIVTSVSGEEVIFESNKKSILYHSHTIKH